MTVNKTLKTLALTVLIALSSEPVFAQDLLARQAPVDRRAKRLDSIEVKALTERENTHTPAAQIYGDEWDNRYAHRATELPDSFVINLRHFCMPTLDIKVYIGDTIRSAFSGKVRIVRYEAKGYGNYIVIRHPNGLETIYGHLSKHLVTENQVVRAGEPIGLGGNTGRSTGSHLHFETRLCGVALNPALFFDFRNQDITGDNYVFLKDRYESDSQLATLERGKVNGGSYTRDQVYGEVGRYNEKAEEAATQNAANAPERVYYKVQNGETLASIAKKVGVSVDAICRLNGFRKDQRVKAGMIIRYV